MLKKILIVSAAALGLSSVAMAGDLMEQPAPQPVAAPADTGLYVGIEGGYVDTGWKNVDDQHNFTELLIKDPVTVVYHLYDIESSLKVKDDTGFGGRVFLGYDLNRYFSVEAGYTYFFNKAKLDGRMEITHDSDYIVNPPAQPIVSDEPLPVPGVYHSRVEVKTQAFDLLGKIRAPLADNFDIYAKLGIGYVLSKSEFKDTDDHHHHDNALKAHHHDDDSDSVKRFGVAFGAGIDYSITPNVIVNGEWLHYYGSPKADEDYIPGTNQYMLGVRYKFTNI